MSNQIPNQPLSGNRDELHVSLNIVKGKLPTDLSGYVFVVGPCGSVNSGGLPYPEKNPDGSANPEFGTPLMNGDGMVYRLDLTKPDSVLLKTRIMKTPDYYADEATKVGGATSGIKEYEGFEFKNMGISRISTSLGSRNFLNTLTVPCDFKGDNTPCLVVAYDVGRCFKLDAESLELITPIGKNTEWLPSTPAIVNFPFPIIESSAHPSFDQLTKELFTVNFTKSTKTMTDSDEFLNMKGKNLGILKKGLLVIKKKFAVHNDINRAVGDIEGLFFPKLKNKKEESPFALENDVFLCKFDNSGAMKKWKLIDSNGNGIAINQSMHQTSITEDYVVLCDSSFKFTLDLLFLTPFPNDYELDNFIRSFLTKPMDPKTNLYIVNRKDLVDGKDTVVFVKSELPFECYHYTTEYLNNDGIITLFAAHNNAACVAEWLRPYDKLKLSGEPVDPQLMGLFSLGEMDLGCIARYEIEASSGKIVSEIINAEKGKNLPTPSAYKEKPDNFDIGGHTWGTGLYTFKDMISDSVPSPKLKYLYWLSFGLNKNALTEFIYDLYKDYENRNMPVDDLLQYTEKGIPYCLTRINGETLEIEDYYQAEMYNVSLYSIQFVPKSTSVVDVDDQMNGYLLTTVQVNELGMWQSQIWLFDCANLKQGPICKMSHPELSFGFTLHSTWMSTASSLKSNYVVDIQEDYNELIDKIIWPWRKKKMKSFFNNYIYPHYTL